MTANFDRDTCVKFPLALGPRVEEFVLDEQAHGDVIARVEAAFEDSYRERYIRG